MEIFSEGIGWVGSICFITAFYLVSRGVITGEGIAYNAINLAGGMSYAVYATLTTAWPVLALEVVWISIALVALWKCFKGFGLGDKS